MYWRVARRTARRWGARVVSAWRRSIQLRVVAITMAFGLIAVTAVAVFLAEEISQRLFESRQRQAELEAAQGLDDFRAQLKGLPANTPAEVQRFLNDAVPSLEETGAGSARSVVLLRSPNNDSDVAVFELAGVAKELVPAGLRRQVQVSTGQYYQSIAMPSGNRQVPGLVIGQQVAIPLAGPYELYFVFSLQREQETLDSVQRVLALGGAALVVLVGGVAYVVTRLVVAPVRQAAQVAVRLADGDLHERMEVHGEDELARLARSFNDMAGSLQHQIERMEELSRLQRRFVSDVSHELRTPLTTIRMAAEVLYEARQSFDPSISRSAELMSTQVDRFEALLSDLLEISRFDAGAAALESAPADMRDIVERIVDFALPLAEARGSRVRTYFPDTSCSAEMDTRRVERILRNLVVNAVEHGEGKPIDVRLACDADAVAVVVRDHGVGLRPQDAERVFDRFWRADPARARTTGGTGLGLAISMEDARLHGGTLEVWGHPGDGASFRLTLPRRAGGVVTRSPLPLMPDDRKVVRGTVALREGARDAAS